MYSGAKGAQGWEGLLKPSVRLSQGLRWRHKLAERGQLSGRGAREGEREKVLKLGMWSSSKALGKNTGRGQRKSSLQLGF